MTALNAHQFGVPEDPDKVPNPYFTGRPLAFQERMGPVPDDAWDHAPVRRVKVRDLVHTQHWLDKEKLDYLASQRRPKGELPQVVEHAGVQYLYDGHHRVSIALQRSQKTTKAKVAER